MNTKRIVLASVLKPVDDPRMYYKFARSLSSANKYQVNIVGFPTKAESNDPDIEFFPLDHFSRKSNKRWMAQIAAAQKIWKLKPDVLIVSTHELLSTALFCRFFLGSKILYDIQENYRANLKHRGTWKSRLAGWVIRIKETLASPFFDHFILAEKSYLNELPFVRRKYSILENKALRPEHPWSGPITFTKPPEKFLFTGTLARQTGILTAIGMIEQLRICIPNARLTVVGNSMDEDFFVEVKSLLEKHDWITAVIDREPIPYIKILKAISSSDIGIIAYEQHEFLRHKQPTKLFEYLGNSLPILFDSVSEWSKNAEKLQAAAPMISNDSQRWSNQILGQQFYTKQPDEELYWDYFSLLKLINELY